MSLKNTYVLLSYLRAIIEADQKGRLPTERICFSDMSYHAEGSRVLVTDKKDGQRYECLLRPIELATGNATIPRGFGDAKESE